MFPLSYFYSFADSFCAIRCLSKCVLCSSIAFLSSLSPFQVLLFSSFPSLFLLISSFSFYNYIHIYTASLFSTFFFSLVFLLCILSLYWSYLFHFTRISSCFFSVSLSLNMYFTILSFYSLFFFCFVSFPSIPSFLISYLYLYFHLFSLQFQFNSNSFHIFKSILSILSPCSF